MTQETLNAAAPQAGLRASYFRRALCPSCGGESARPQPAVYSAPRAEDQAFEQVKGQWHGFFKQKAFFSYHRCSGCGLLFCKDFFTPSQLEELYAMMPDNTAGVDLPALIKTQAGYFEALKRFSPLKGSYLEVGPDIGLFTQCVVREGSFSRYFLFEPNKGVTPVLEKLLEGRDFRILPAMLDMAVLPKRELSAVVMVHVLDHVVEPLKLLAELKETLAPGAVVLFVTHDEGSLLARALGRRWPPYCVQHPHLFRPSSMTALMKEAGYKVLAIEKSVNHFPAAYLAKHALWTLGLKVPVPGFQGLTLPLKLGNIITVATPEA